MTQPSKPLVSVIVPIYNVRDYVGACLESLKAQACGDFEVVCVNDGSTDDSVEVARAAAGDDARFVFVERSNGGLSAARNTGIEHARGEYLVFLDSDDLYEPRAIERMAASAQAGDLDLLDFSATTFYEDDEMRGVLADDYTHRMPVDGIMTGQELYVEYTRRGQYVPSACMHLVRRSLLERANLRFGEGLLHEDELFSPMLYAYARRAAFLCEGLYKRRIRKGSIMTERRTVRNVDSVFRISQLLHAWVIEHADECTAEFVDAYTLNLSHMRYLGYRYAQQVEEDELAAYVASLSSQDRIDFDLTIRYASKSPADALDDVESSRAYRAARTLGDALARFRRG